MWAAGLAVAILLLVGSPAWAQLSGAIFTTLEDGTVVNGNIYDDCDDVYLDGGPPLNAPQSAAGLPDGEYYFQVTDPSGKVLLSEDGIEDRRFEVIDGVIANNLGTHATGIDVDHGALTIQLMPFEQTPNNGNVHKAWITPVDAYDAAAAAAGERGHGFIPRWSKTDNFKCKGGRPIEPPTITILKFNDVNGNCVLDEGVDEPVPGWTFFVVDQFGVPNEVATDENGVATAMLPNEVGGVTVSEGLTAAFAPCDLVEVDGALVAGTLDLLGGTFFVTAQITASGSPNNPETHEVAFINQFLTEQEICKFYDINRNGVWDDGEPGVPGWKFRVFDSGGTEIDDSPVETGEDGCVSVMLPAGDYTIEECPALDDRWVATTPTTCQVSIAEISSLDIALLLSVIPQSQLEPAPGEPCEFGNVCIEEVIAEFSTKGYWHNKNGLAELAACTEGDIQGFMDAVVNVLDPYDDPSGYFSKGDEPFDGEFANGDPVPAGKGVLENEDIADAGTVEAEISNFLIDNNGDGGPSEQLAQQLLAFIFNTFCRSPDPDAVLCDDPDLTSLIDLIDAALDAWTNGTDAERVAIKDVLDALNNNNGGAGVCLEVVHDLADCLPVEFEP